MLKICQTVATHVAGIRTVNFTTFFILILGGFLTFGATAVEAIKASAAL